jgi:hypothetical protein
MSLLFAKKGRKKEISERKSLQTNGYAIRISLFFSLISSSVFFYITGTSVFSCLAVRTVLHLTLTVLSLKHHDSLVRSSLFHNKSLSSFRGSIFFPTAYYLFCNLRFRKFSDTFANCNLSMSATPLRVQSSVVSSGNHHSWKLVLIEITKVFQNPPEKKAYSFISCCYFSNSPQFCSPYGSSHRNSSRRSRSSGVS